jgi:hypothetical protein
MLGRRLVLIREVEEVRPSSEANAAVPSDAEQKPRGETSDGAWLAAKITFGVLGLVSIGALAVVFWPAAPLAEVVVTACGCTVTEAARKLANARWHPANA